MVAQRRQVLIASHESSMMQVFVLLHNAAAAAGNAGTSRRRRGERAAIGLAVLQSLTDEGNVSQEKTAVCKRARIGRETFHQGGLSTNAFFNRRCWWKAQDWQCDKLLPASMGLNQIRQLCNAGRAWCRCMRPIKVRHHQQPAPRSRLMVQLHQDFRQQAQSKY